MPRPAAQSFRDLLVWQKAHAFVLEVYRFTESFSDREKFGLSHQMRRAAVSIPANIAEGFGKRSHAEKARFWNIAEGSLGGVPLLPDPRPGSRLRPDGIFDYFTRRDEPATKRLRACDSGFWLLTSGFHIPKGYQGRSPCLVRAISGRRTSRTEGRFLLLEP